MSEKFRVIKSRIGRSIPLAPVFIAIFSFIAMFSPAAWQSGLIMYFAFGIIGLSFVCAYSVTMFVDAYFQDNNRA
ncbi:hypothetical protein [Methylotenera versatilis]|uniref:hypothetical protein n=1 Tax=Methylotenera versatilis TaxID=1055487 RepID=UPI0006472DE3|nr:hypothetical protein [Methylotenera versatilis]